LQASALACTTAENRATYVAVSNTAIGLVLLAGGVFGLVAQGLGVPATIGLLGLLSLAGAAMASRLDEVTGERGGNADE
jgi:hypothetical protein